MLRWPNFFRLGGLCRHVATRIFRGLLEEDATHYGVGASILTDGDRDVAGNVPDQIRSIYKVRRGGIGVCIVDGSSIENR